MSDTVRAGAGPERRAIARAAALAFVTAAVLLVTVVLPAEYGVDPLGTGRALGLGDLAAPALAQPLPPPEGEALAPVAEGNVSLYPAEYKVDSREFVLGPYEYIEYKYHLARGAVMLFSWRADGDVVQDLHGVPDGATGSASEQSYDKRPRREAAGSVVAPVSGIHGWFWENPGTETVTVRLTTAGFYSSAQEFHFNGRRVSRGLRGLEAIPVSRD